MLGGDEFGIGTASLVAMGCIMVRQCHSNTCPVGVCTQDPKLRAKFEGSPEKIVNLFTFVAEEVREILASLGFKRLIDVIGRSDLLTQVLRGDETLDDLDLNPLLVQADPGEFPRYCTLEGRNEVPETLDEQMIRDAAPALEGGEKMQLAYNIRNVYRAIGTKLSSKITRKYGMTGLKPGQITVRLRGSAGQSLGAFAVQGLKLEVFGDANDYVGKGLSGGTIVVRPFTSSPLVSNANTIVGNTVLYGATAGRMFAAGQAAERFAVRNSGATAVVEGCGSNGCEYMTGGTIVILGAVGDNFAAGMTGGMGFVYDADGTLERHLNLENVIAQGVETAHWEGVLKELVEEHARETQSAHALRILADWDREIVKFKQIVPKEMVARLGPSRAPRRQAPRCGCRRRLRLNGGGRHATASSAALPSADPRRAGRRGDRGRFHQPRFDRCARHRRRGPILGRVGGLGFRGPPRCGHDGVGAALGAGARGGCVVRAGRRLVLGAVGHAGRRLACLPPRALCERRRDRAP